MPTSRAGRATRRPGFTLIELLVVITLLAILSLGVGLTAGGAFRGHGSTLANRLQAAVAQARDGAILGRVTTGLRPGAQGWALMRRDGVGGWQVQDAPVRDPAAVLVWQIGGRAFLPTQAEPAGPPILFHPDGTATGFSLVIGRGSRRQGCTLDATESLSCDTD